MIDRDTAIKRIRTALKRRSGKLWSVCGDRGTAWGWITIMSPPRRRTSDFDYMTEEDRAELGQLLGENEPAHCQGVSVSPESREFYLEQAERRYK